MARNSMVRLATMEAELLPDFGPFCSAMVGVFIGGVIRVKGARWAKAYLAAAVDVISESTESQEAMDRALAGSGISVKLPEQG